MLALFAGTLVLYSWFLQSPYFEPLYNWCQAYLGILVPIVILIKVIGIVWPPLPGGFASIAVIPLVGFFWACMADLIGTIIGCSIAYLLGRRYGRDFLAKVLGEKFADQASKLKVKEGREYEALLILRVLGAGVLVEAISYGAGLIKMDYRKFILGTIGSHLLVVFPSFYLYSKLYESQNIYLVALSLVITLPILWKVKGRYFEEVIS